MDINTLTTLGILLLNLWFGYSGIREMTQQTEVSIFYKWMMPISFIISGMLISQLIMYPEVEALRKEVNYLIQLVKLT